jgi:hypothetical protein
MVLTKGLEFVVKLINTVLVSRTGQFHYSFDKLYMDLGKNASRREL